MSLGMCRCGYCGQGFLAWHDCEVAQRVVSYAEVTAILRNLARGDGVEMVVPEDHAERRKKALAVSMTRIVDMRQRSKVPERARVQELP